MLSIIFECPKYYVTNGLGAKCVAHHCVANSEQAHSTLSLSICQNMVEIFFYSIPSGRRKDETGFSIETLCHDPALPLYGVMLDDYNNSECEMKEKNTTNGPAHFCSCTAEECNDVIKFSPGEFHQTLQTSPLSKSRSAHQAMVSVSFHPVYCQATMFWSDGDHWSFEVMTNEPFLQVCSCGGEQPSTCTSLHNKLFQY